MYAHLFSPLDIDGLKLKNRITMAPMYLGYAKDGAVNEALLEHYRLMAASGVALVVVENATIDHPTGSGSSHDSGG
jgi:2,4-dienoyl-CoA reductase (NADPH2)